MPILPYTYQIVEKTPRQAETLTDLAVMGVPPAYWSKFPLPDAYPTKFSDEGRIVWNEMLLSDEYATRIRNQTLDGAWHNAITLFLDLCDEEGVAPFLNSTDTTRNEFVLSALRTNRIRLVKFMNDFGMFTEQELMVRKSYREYVRTDVGFIVSSWADMFPYPNMNRVVFEDWLTSTEIHGNDRFQRYVDNHYVHQIVPTLQVWVKCVNMLRIQVGFTIEVKGTVNIPGNKTPTRKEVDAFLDQRFWFPLLRQHRMDGVVTRLF